MALDRLRRRLGATSTDLDRARLHDRYAGLDLVAIADAPLRRPVRLGGEVQETRLRPGGARRLEVTITDGSGRATAVFTGRDELPGLAVGRGLVIEGVARRDRGRLLVLNPAYTLLP